MFNYDIVIFIVIKRHGLPGLKQVISLNSRKLTKWQISNMTMQSRNDSFHNSLRLPHQRHHTMIIPTRRFSKWLFQKFSFLHGFFNVIIWYNGRVLNNYPRNITVFPIALFEILKITSFQHNSQNKADGGFINFHQSAECRLMTMHPGYYTKLHYLAG